uniref:V-type proton ATPase subunit E n=1 Tax=Hemiselmis andersenii TaxID=464988 RepID=A0A7S0Y0G8_HEMAN|mmetsp:Transcript_34856/g.81350  ORF Transcript_34856/g.81350 Transcript_34856/m.81350 type:complete len:231 (+) Transcript_34856:112-804(+)
MDQQAVNKQIKQMVEFIKQEANEKAHEILIKAEEEFNIEKLRLVEQEKVKVKSEYETKHKQIEIKRRIAFSNEVNANRLKVLTSRDEVLTSVKAVVANELGKIGEPSNAAYKDLMLKLTVQGLYQMMEPAVVVRVRQSDSSIANAIIKDAAAQYKSGTGKEVTITVDKEYLPKKDDTVNPCYGGVKLFTPDFMTAIDNSLNGRLDVVLAQKLPDIKIALFGRSATRRHID